MKKVYVIGHRNPDTDSICSAIAYANLKNELNYKAVAKRLGPLNEETKYVLKKFDVEIPEIIEDARSQICDIDIDKANIINSSFTIKETWKKLLENEMHALCVVDDNSKLIGYVTSSNLASLRTTHYKKIEEYMRHATTKNLANTLKGEIVLDCKDFSHSGAIYIITLINSEEYKTKVKNGICILSDNTKNQIEIIKNGAKCLVIACDKEVDKSVIKLAKKMDCALIKTQKDSMAIAQVINESFPISLIMTKDISTFNENDYVDDVLKQLLNYRFRSFPIIDNEGKLKGVISRFHLLKYKKKRFILVDHSATNQSLLNITKARIEEIIDHHHIGNIETDHPILYRNQVCGCTASIVAQMYKENGITPSVQMAGIMLGAIISDTLHFKSATTTKFDVRIANELANIANINLDDYALEVLGASVALVDASMTEILNRDLKEYEVNKYKVAIGQTNYYKTEDLQSILPKFKENLEKEQGEKLYDLVIMMFTHVTGKGSMLVYSGKIKGVVENIIETKIDDNTGYDQSMISRKQQLMPKLLDAIRTL